MAIGMVVCVSFCNVYVLVMCVLSSAYLCWKCR